MCLYNRFNSNLCRRPLSFYPQNTTKQKLILIDFVYNSNKGLGLFTTSFIYVYQINKIQELEKKYSYDIHKIYVLAYTIIVIIFSSSFVFSWYTSTTFPCIILFISFSLTNPSAYIFYKVISINIV